MFCHVYPVDTKVEGVSEPGSALGPDWHRELHLRGLTQRKNVKILYETECSRVTSSSEQSNFAKDINFC